MRTGYIPMRVLQIRETAGSRFSVITDNEQRQNELCAVLEQVCATDAPCPHDRMFRFSPQALDDIELSRAAAAKPSLFRPMLDEGDGNFTKYF